MSSNLLWFIGYALVLIIGGIVAWKKSGLTDEEYSQIFEEVYKK